MAADATRLAKVFPNAAQQKAIGVNALLFGPPGTGKTEFARALAHAAGLTLYQVRNADEDGDGMGREGRLTAYLIAQRLLKNRHDAVILFDEVEDVFADDEGAMVRMLFGAVQSGGKEKGFMNRLLETNPVPAIWVTNDVRVMDAAFLRRFLLPVEFTIPPRTVRRKMVERHLGDRNLPGELLDELAADNKLAPAQFGDARRLLGLHDDQNDTRENERIVREGVASIRRLLHGTRSPMQRRTTTTFDVAFLNIAGGIAPQKIATALDRTGRGSLCFYGPPGTGKSEFVHVLADALGRELVIKQSSDLVSKYVGETEQNIAKLFNTIDAERSILFIDEVDSFLRDRREAEHSWEITAVNELLQHMENYPGIFIAATNLMAGIDAAALRRFDFKLAFQPLSLPQRVAFFAREALGDIEAGTALPSAIVNRLAQLESLTPGDFANVCRQRDILAEDLAPEEFLRRLVQECRWKAAA
ncbi:MAG: ATP-binding protein [Rhodocyclaceae bacterium]|nr:ATP-binding protein [Rhodocyclaceae bacterium]